MVDVAVEKFGGLHVAFNNAGVFETGTFADITEDALDKLVNINFKSLVYCFKYQVWLVLRYMWGISPFDHLQQYYLLRD